MSGSAFAVTHHAFSSGAGRTSDGNGSHASTLKSPSYTKSVSWQHYRCSILLSCIFMVKLKDDFIASKNRTVYLQQIERVQSSENILFSNRMFFCWL
ncbi:hypothetical protein [Mixta sp. Marseille-Q2659]|uniref:hypothetical protein n=1 Tax=Mixta sp. Marseille-Q2659 TaxID=2736607 RepID=UPI0023B8FCBA|nr:hypothetical protein [Mixta sp. Marseille-Q2659]